MYNVPVTGPSSSLRRPNNLDLFRNRHARTLHDLDAPPKPVRIHWDTARLQHKIRRERQAFDRQEAMVRQFHRNVEMQRAHLAAQIEENGALLAARIEYMTSRRERLLVDKVPRKERLPVHSYPIRSIENAKTVVELEY
jgi:hypothetical protein